MGWSALLFKLLPTLINGAVLLAKAFISYFLGKKAGKADQQNTDLKATVNVKDKQAEAARKSPKSKSAAIDELRDGDAF